MKVNWLGLRQFNCAIHRCKNTLEVSPSVDLPSVLPRVGWLHRKIINVGSPYICHQCAPRFLDEERRSGSEPR
jgi:hypothetical protein